MTLSELTTRLEKIGADLEEIAELAAELAHHLERGWRNPEHELCELLAREFGVTADGPVDRLRLELAVRDITAVILAPYLADAAELADRLSDLTSDSDEDDGDSREAFLCLDCGEDTLELGEYYMLDDEVWAATGVAPNGGRLCIGCVEKRLGRRLEPPDFKPVEMNLVGSERLLSRVYGRAEAPVSAQGGRHLHAVAGPDEEPPAA